MKLRVALLSMLRESRGSRGRMLFFTGCLAVGVAAVTGVAGLTAAMEGGMRAQARSLLSADLVVESRRPLPEILDETLVDVEGLRRTDVRELATMAAGPGSAGGDGEARLVELKVVDGVFPYYGDLVLDPRRPLDTLLGADGVVVAPELLSSLGLRLGDPLRVGGADFTITGRVLEEPTRLGFSLTLGPRVFMGAAGLERTALMGYGSRVRYKAMLAMPPDTAAEELDALEDRIEAATEGENVSVRSPADSERSVSRGIDRVERTLGLVALLSLILGGIGVAQIVRAWLAGKVQSVAVLRCLGVLPRQIVVLYLGHVLSLALVGSLLGGLLGMSLPVLVVSAAPDLVPREMLHLWQPGALLRGVVLGLGIALVFSLPALASLWRVPPARVLRSEAAPLALPRAVQVGAIVVLLGGVLGAAYLQSRRWDAALVFTGAVGVLAGLLAGAARGVTWVVGHMKRERLPSSLVHGLAALARPGAGTTGALMALGLGVMVVVLMQLVQTRVGDELRSALPKDAPSTFMVDIQPDQWPGIEGELDIANARNVDAVPVVMGRLAHVDGRPVAEILAEREQEPRGRRRAGWVLTREQRLTWRSELPEGNVLVEGELWSDPERPEVSLEEDFAEDLGVTVGDTLGFDIQGVVLDFVVTSVRTVEWATFGINFFIMAEPGSLDDAPQATLAAARVDEEREQPLRNALAADYPNVTLLAVRAILEKVVAVMERLAFGVRLLGSFTIVTGLIILAGAVSSTTLRRRREVALLKTLGVTRGGVASLLAVEFALLGLVSGLLGGLTALGLAWGFLEYVVELEPELSLMSVALSALGAAALATVAGLVASSSALRTRPLASLRG